MPNDNPPNVIWTRHKKSGTWYEEPEAAADDRIPSSEEWEDIECRCIPLNDYSSHAAKIAALTEALDACLPVLVHYSNTGKMPDDFTDEDGYCKALAAARAALAL